MSQALRERWEALYRQAEYRVLLYPEPLVFRIGHYEAQIERRLLAASAFQRECCILTACNPGSAITDAALNQRYSDELREQIAMSGLRSIAALNIDPSRTWPDEPGFLLIDADRQRVIELGRHFQQNAIVSITLGQAPSLIWLDSL